MRLLMPERVLKLFLLERRWIVEAGLTAPAVSADPRLHSIGRLAFLVTVCSHQGNTVHMNDQVTAGKWKLVHKQYTNVVLSESEMVYRTGQKIVVCFCIFILACWTQTVHLKSIHNALFISVSLNFLHNYPILKMWAFVMFTM